MSKFPSFSLSSWISSSRTNPSVLRRTQKDIFRPRLTSVIKTGAVGTTVQILRSRYQACGCCGTMQDLPSKTLVLRIPRSWNVPEQLFSMGLPSRDQTYRNPQFLESRADGCRNTRTYVIICAWQKIPVVSLDTYFIVIILPLPSVPKEKRQCIQLF